MLDAARFGVLLLCAVGLGAGALSVLRVPCGSTGERLALSCAAGLGLLAIGLGWLGLMGELGLARWIVPAGALLTLERLVRHLAIVDPPARWSPSLPGVVALAMLLAAVLGAIAPVTESDSLAYPLPIAERLAREQLWRFWPDLARSVYPLSQEFLGAALIGLGFERIGLLSAMQLVIAGVLMVVLAERLEVGSRAGWIAVIIAFGCPAVAFVAGSAKEDALLVMMAVAGVLALKMPPTAGAAAAAGLFAGLAAGAKYTGLPIGLAIVVCVPFVRDRPRRISSLALAAVVALAAGGLWYGVNLARFGNPVVPFMPTVGHFPVTEETAAEWLTGFGYGRRPADFLFAPFRMGLEVLSFRAGEFGGRGNWINPLIWVGVPWALLNPRLWRVYLPLLVVSLALYITWFAGMQVARLLLPAAALLSIPAAAALLQASSRLRLLRQLLSVVLVVSAGVVIAVGGLRFGRYVADPVTFLERETEHFAAIQWMNEHLDPTRDRVVTHFRASAYLRIPWMNLAPDYQVEIHPTDLSDASRLRTALKRRGFTHVFGTLETEGLEPWLVPVYTNPRSRLGGVHFFRPPPSEPVSIFALR